MGEAATEGPPTGGVAATLEVDTMSAASPDLTPRCATELENSIARLGQLVPIVMWRGKVIDGRKRLAACIALGRDPIVAVIPDDATATEHAGALNLLRTHYTSSQRAMYASRLATLTQGDGARRRMAKDPRASGANLHQMQTDGGLSAKEAADAAGVCQRDIRTAKRVRRDAAPEVVAAVERGDLTLYAARQVADRVPREEQPAAVAKVIRLKVGRRNMPADALGEPGFSRRKMGRVPKIEKALDGFVTQLEGVSEMLDHYSEKPLPDTEQCTAIAVRIEKAMAVLRRALRRLAKGAEQ